MGKFLLLTVIVFYVAICNTSIGPTGGVTFAAMATLLPPPAVIPIHAFIEGVSGAGRALLLCQYANWRLAVLFCSFGLMGFAIGVTVLDFGFLNNDVLTIILGITILVTT